MIAAATTKRGFTQVRVELDGCPVQVRRLNVRHDLLQFGEGSAVTGRENDLAGAAVGTGEALGKLVGELLGACECGVWFALYGEHCVLILGKNTPPRAPTGEVPEARVFER